LNVVLVSTYELGRQPFGLASPAAWLAREGAAVRCLDLAVEPLDEAAVREAGLVAFHVPMHTATRLAALALRRVRALNPRTHVCFYGLYASVNERYLRGLGAQTILGGEFESGLAELVRRLGAGLVDAPERVVSLSRQSFLVPDRAGLPPLSKYAKLHVAHDDLRVAGYTEASRGCKHLCRHCPIVPVYGGRFRVVDREVVLEDVGQQVAGGAEHVTFGDPDFFNGPTHAMAIVEALHERFPALTYDVTIKVEHLLQQRRLLPLLARTNCLFVTTAVEALDDAILERLDKRHTRADFVEVLAASRAIGPPLNPTFVSFTPWTTAAGYRELLAAIAELDLVEQIAPIQYAIRLLIPAGSRLLELAEIRDLVGPFDAEALVHPWVHPDPAVDRLHEAVLALVREAQTRHEARGDTFERLCELAGVRLDRLRALDAAPPRATIPFLTEPWYC
jgi:radical SAM superfamily enzyme YgiQ (UPF0313 family)